MVQAILVLMTLLLVSTSSAAQAKKDDSLDHIDLYLHTFDVGNMIYTNFGHSAIRVKNRKAGTDVIYNWGMFDFGSPLSFSLKFYMGDLRYRLGVYSYRRAMAQYKYDRRTIWEDKLNFTPEEKKVFYERIVRNNTPEEAYFQYQYFFANCSTKIRDHIDATLGKTWEASLEGQTSAKSFRDMVREGYQLNPSMDFLLEIGMNSRLDRPMTRWEAMFHPFALREELLTFRNGVGDPLMIEGKKIVTFPRPEAYPYVFRLLAAILAVPLVFAIFLLQKRAWKSEPEELLEPFIGLRILGILALPLILFFGFCGLVLPLNWLLSGHQDLHHNVNMMFFLPFDWVFLPVAWHLLRKKSPKLLTQKYIKILRKYLILHLLLGFAVIYTWATGDGSQDVGRVMLVAIPYKLTLALMVNFGLTSGKTEGKKRGLSARRSKPVAGA